MVESHATCEDVCVFHAVTPCVPCTPCTVSAVARQVTWSRKARRERQRSEQTGQPPAALPPPVEGQEPLFAAKIQVVPNRAEKDSCLLTLTLAEGDCDQLHAFELHFARYLAKKHTLPDLPEDLEHARNI